MCVRKTLVLYGVKAFNFSSCCFCLGVSVIPLLDSLFDLDAIYAKDAQWMHMAERERVWCADVSNTLQSSLRRHVLLPDNIRLRQKVNIAIRKCYSLYKVLS